MACGRELCPDCVASEEVGTSSFEACVHCDGGVRVLTMGGSIESYGALLVQSLRVPIGLPTLGVAVAIWALVFVAAGTSGWAAGLIWGLLIPVLFWLLFFAALKSAARGADVVSGAVNADMRAELLWPALRMTALCWGSALVAWLATRAGVSARSLNDDWRYWAVVLALGVCLPAWVMALGRGDGLVQAITPSTSLSLVRALGGDYARSALLSVLTCALLFFWLGAAALGVSEGFTAYGVLMEALSLYGALLLARLIGLVMSTRADAVGIGFRPDQLVPALPGALPRGVRRAKPAPPPERPRPEAIELDVSSPSGPMVLTAFGSPDPPDED